MSTLYKPVLIESAEQAEALPEGTVAINTPSAKWDMAYMRTDHNPPWYASTDGDSHTYHDEMVGCIALVPIEAEEVRVIASGALERDMHGATILNNTPDGTPSDYRRTEFHTPWEEA